MGNHGLIHSPVVKWYGGRNFTRAKIARLDQRLGGGGETGHRWRIARWGRAMMRSGQCVLGMGGFECPRIEGREETRAREDQGMRVDVVMGTVREGDMEYGGWEVGD